MRQNSKVNHPQQNISVNTYGFYAVHTWYEIVIMNSVKRLRDQSFKYFVD